MTTNIARISQIAKERPKEIFTSVYHMINLELLKECYDELDGNKAIGIDGITKKEYGNKLEENLKSIVKRLKDKNYRPSPARKVKTMLIRICRRKDKVNRIWKICEARRK